jgi:Trk K+ transport system NAD-binding subunit
MVVFVVVVQFVGVFLVFLIIPIYLVPFLEERFEERLPRTAPPNIHDHVLIYRYGPAVEMLIDQLRERGRPHLVIETEEDQARLLVERGVPVVFSRDETEALSVAALDRARSMVVNGSDEENAGATLRARQMGFTGDILAIVEEPLRRHALELAGATAVFTPRHILAAALAARASTRIHPQLGGIQQLGSRVEVRELRIQPSSPLVGKTLRDSGIAEQSGANVIAQWVGGRLIAPAAPSMVLEKRGILVVVGAPESLDALAALAAGTARIRREGFFVIAGFGEVGRKVHELLTDAGEQVRTIDRRSRPGVDLVGNVFDPGVLKEIGVGEAQAVVLSLDSDDATLFGTVLVQDLAPDATVIARVNQARNIENIHRAGADFALSISQVAGQMLLHRLIGQQALSLDTHLKILKTTGSNVKLAKGRAECPVIAVERGKDVIVDVPRDFVFRPDDAVYVCGTDQAIRSLV